MTREQARETQLELELKSAVDRADWLAAGKASDELRMRHGWKYARMVELYGAERWEEIAQEIDEAEAAS